MRLTCVYYVWVTCVCELTRLQTCEDLCHIRCPSKEINKHNSYMLVTSLSSDNDMTRSLDLCKTTIMK